MRPQTARLIAAAFLCVGVLLGIFDAPQYFSRLTGVELNFLNIPYRLGLDIQGGTHLRYQADLGNISTPDYASSMEAVRDVIERRVNLFGVAEPLVQVEKSGKDWRLIVELAGIKDINAAIKLIGETPYLEFREETPEEERNKILESQKKGERLSEDPYFTPTILTGRQVKRSALDFDQTTFQPQINLELTDEGGKIFKDLTRRNVGKQLAIYLDGAPISAPVVREEIAGGKAQITGNFTPQSAKELVGRLNAGALPVPIKLISQQSVEASLGQESLERSLQAGLIGFLAVTLFMIFWYRLPGMLAVMALLLYAALVLAIFKLIPVTLTVAGIAGFILSIGMAVDANVLIFERLKEELRQGKSLEEGIYEGFSRAWTSIRDSNISSLITSAILYWMGTSMVQGFALTLGVGILVSMFSAISVTRTLLIAFMSRRLESLRFLFLNGLAR
ncbi:MAG: protein translocase subunit SecD [Candidatus Sungiibacteriota bacterium]|uniref:Protein translocase subunit SecD n=1 Tax=Candidatus Sungiibacteriota bacterium TaxID=2750080 RepID=A0A7T5RKF6_9BACT|nr:MAG: protein translocase subunit SecD [Candidatus Sungbacteria bacterium]